MIIPSNKWNWEETSLLLCPSDPERPHERQLGQPFTKAEQLGKKCGALLRAGLFIESTRVKL